MDLLATVFAVFLFVGWLDVSAKVGPIDFDGSRQCAFFARKFYTFADLVQQYERCFVINVQIARQLQRAVALRAVYEDCDCGEGIADRQFVAGKDGARGQAVLL